MRSAFIFLVVALTAISGQAVAEKRVALVIGNSAYQHAVQLANPKNDSSDMAAKLQSLGFEVVSDKDLDLAGMRRTVRDFLGKLDGADMALFYYAGHGLQVNGNNYMVPVDAQLSGYNDLDFEALPMDLILSAMERSTRVNLIFLDACRDNPFAEKLSRSMGTRSGSVGRGLARLGSGVGSLIAFATQPGNVAMDGTGRNSPFTTALLAHLGTPGQDITRDLIDVRRDVLAATEGKQVPWENSSLTGEVVLKPLATTQPNAVSAPAPQAASPDNSVELAYWATIKDSTDRSFFEAYLQQFPTGAFAALARLKIDAIDKRVEAERQAAAKQPEQERAATATGEAKATEVASLEQPDALAQSPAGITDPGALAMATQAELARIGCLAGQADGKWGLGSRKALQDYADRQGLKLASLEPTGGLLERLKAVGDRVCPNVPTANAAQSNLLTPVFRVHARQERAQKGGSDSAYITDLDIKAEKSSGTPNFGLAVVAHSYAPGKIAQLEMFLNAPTKSAAKIAPCAVGSIKYPDGTDHVAIRLSKAGDGWTVINAACLIAALPRKEAAVVRFVTEHFSDVAVGMVADGSINRLTYDLMRDLVGNVATGDVKIADR